MAAIAPMEMPGPAANVIPLQCLICPKKPTFSDLSHLLTHIASKSHLSQKFKVGLRPDPESKADTAAYLDWEARYGINDLLAERLASKEKKTTGKKRARTFASASGPRDRPHDDDTALMMDSIKIEPDEILHAQAIYGWSSSSTRQGYFDNSGFQTPTTRRSRDSATLPSTPQQQHSMILRRRRFPSESTAVSGTTSELLSESTEMPEDTNEGDNATKLKGIVYEGMGLFDSATTPQKKKRNQRKDASVLVKMQQTSRDITSVETVYELTEEGLKRLRERDVYDSPSVDGSQVCWRLSFHPILGQRSILIRPPG
ncbi:hypothetical protein QC763_106680 [Podospora pseudopauciseta]|uniref:C2H2-type domain-containing protein n=1 Tax=Podospora pseudopauciseta TaxID=2093780 RepID=A0ABR0HY06_9PEZI|nr:hypothetical protein QC763_106680 [Podospora pseudopauciseta]